MEAVRGVWSSAHPLAKKTDALFSPLKGRNQASYADLRGRLEGSDLVLFAAISSFSLSL